MSAVGSVVLRAAHAARKSDTLALLEDIRQEPFVTPEEARARQFARLQDLLRHCEARVPFYRQRWAEAGVRATEVRSWADFARLPVLTKDEVRAHRDAMVAEGVPQDSLLLHQSGGSTGVPLSFYRDPGYVTASEAGTYRNLLQAGWRPGEMIAFFWGSSERMDRMSRAEFVARQWLRRMYQFDPFRSGPEDMERWWRTWKLIRPRVALGYASTIARFAQHLEAIGARPGALRGVFTTAEKLYRPQREQIERVFRAPVFDCYGSSEVQNIATQCREGRMHVNADFVVVETAGGDGTTPEPLLVTSLLNRVMPLVRYRNEDCGRVLEGSCTCGSGFPLMSLEVARVSDNFHLPNGRVVHGEYFTHLMYGSEGVASFQFHQTSVDRIVIRYQRAAAGDPQPALARAAAAVAALAPGLVRVEVEQVAEIPLSTAGKHRFTRSDVTA